MSVSDPVPDDLFSRPNFGQAAYSERLSVNYSVNTPERELKIVRSFADIGLDPCGNEHSTVGAKTSWFGNFDSVPKANKVDGLVENWVGNYIDGEIVYFNPPYGKAITAWVNKANAESLNGLEAIGLLPARVDTRWFRSVLADRICWYNKRVSFVDPKVPDRKDSAKFPSVFVYYGKRTERFESVFKEHGVVTSWLKGDSP